MLPVAFDEDEGVTGDEDLAGELAITVTRLVLAVTAYCLRTRPARTCWSSFGAREQPAAGDHDDQRPCRHGVREAPTPRGYGGGQRCQRVTRIMKR